MNSIGETMDVSEAASKNIAPRLRMTTVYAIGQTMGALVAGTGNRSERYTGYFTKWGDGAFDFNPISDLLVEEIYEFLEYLGAPESIIKKAPSAGLFEGQTDEQEMGVTYAAIDKYITTGEGTPEDVAIIKRMHDTTAHKRTGSRHYNEISE
jgi:NAD+ synthase